MPRPKEKARQGKQHNAGSQNPQTPGAFIRKRRYFSGKEDFINYSKTRDEEFKSFVKYNFTHIYYDFYFQRIDSIIK